MKTTILKGGSLSRTSLVEFANTKFVRKEISLGENREYGFVRWYSQVKKMQRMSAEFPDLFPKILEVRCNELNAWVDLEYLEGFKDIKTLLSEDMSVSQIEKMHASLWKAFDALHSKTFKPIHKLPKLYYQEEIKQKIQDACQHKEFRDFYEGRNFLKFVYDKEEVAPLQTYVRKLTCFLNDTILDHEGFIHGNPTLENIMYSIKDDRIVFIDLYEESIIDTKYLDYSQVLQCSRSNYGYINDGEVIVDRNSVSHSVIIPQNIGIFNNLFELELSKRLSPAQLKLVNVLEATQFIRMLPFKCLAGEIDKAKYFYVHALHLLQKVFK